MFNPVNFSPLGLPPGFSEQASEQVSERAQPFTNNGHSRSEELSREAVVSSASRIDSRERFQNAESFSLSLQTRDGDTVTIEFSSDTNIHSRYSATNNVKNDGRSSAMSYSIDRQHSSEFGFTVQGDLDVDEVDAIATLVQDLSQLADEFFNGDLQSSMDLLSGIHFDSSQLAAMDFSMQQTQSYSAISTYQQVQSMGQPPTPDNRALQAYGQQLLEQFSKADLQLEQAKEVTMSLMLNLVQVDTRFSQSSMPEQASLLENIEALEQLITQFGYGQAQFGERGAEH
ncbi:hypothetical protein [Amphritea sp. HPY]|uniref:hypothetical protein n=1 Tax=Amphritea sp. HPY TaxID=3421652 RepID=UPI003D7EA894